MPFPVTDRVDISRDRSGSVTHIEHLQQPFVAAAGAARAGAAVAPELTADAGSARELAEEYLRQVAPILDLEESLLPGSPSRAAPAATGKLELAEEKELLGTTTLAYQQTYDGLPIWEAGVNVTVLAEPLRVTASQSSVHRDIGALATDGTHPPEIARQTLSDALGLGAAAGLQITRQRRLIYRLDPDRRFDPELKVEHEAALQEPPPTLPLPPLPETLQPGRHYLVTEVLFTYPIENFGPVNWRAFIEEGTGVVVYLRAFTTCVNGLVFSRDPATAGAPATTSPTAAAAALNPFRSAVSLAGLNAGNPQSLSGEFVEIVDTVAPVVAPPTVAAPGNFDYDAPTREFSAVNAYHHCDWLFRHLQGMGFNIASYFDGTVFPVPVDACGFSDAVNARAPGNTTGTGSGGFQFGLAGAPFPAVSIAADLRVVLHEFGHTVLWDSVHSPNFGFAHSAGDSLAAIMLDPDSALRTDPVRRFLTFPWVIPNRSHGRDVAAGWGWGGVNDIGSYSSEQILSTTHFRLYRSLGGDSDDLARRQLASRQAMYLIYRAIGSLATNPVTPTPSPVIYATSLMTADIGTLDFEGHRGGAFHKVIRWAFEKQGLYQGAAAPTPVTAAGAPPPVDVYINDGRGGEYPFQPYHWNCTDIWNRLAPSAGGGGGVHESPVVGQTNYAYVLVKNRGTAPAANVVVRGYSADPGAGLAWPADWTPMTTAEIAVPAPIAPGASLVVGPFEWTPRFVGHECMFMEVSADDDLSNIDPRTFFPSATGPTAEWRLVPFDNNIAQRNVVPVAGGGGARGLLTSFFRRRFVVRNPSHRPARFEVAIRLPDVLRKRGWSVAERREAERFELGPNESRHVPIALKPGRDYSTRDLGKGTHDIIVEVRADGILIGGMTYRLAPKLKQAPRERKGERPIRLDHPRIEEALRARGD